MDRIFTLIFKLSLISIFTSSIVGCSNNSSSDDAQTGYFADTPIEGLTYKTASQSGITDARGAFKYQEGEEITFSIGKTDLGTMKAKSKVTLYDFYSKQYIRQYIESDYSDLKLRLRYSYDWEGLYEVIPRDPLHFILNLTIFLQTLDYDNSSENGIQITDDTRKLFTNTHINFKQFYPQFLQDFHFSKTLNQANEENVFPDARRISQPWNALEHLYTSNKIAAPTIQTFTSLADDGDGSLETSTQLIVDEQGNPIRRETDSNGDGITDSIEVFTYDDRGNLLESYSDDLTDVSEPSKPMSTTIPTN